MTAAEIVVKENTLFAGCLTAWAVGIVWIYVFMLCFASTASLLAATCLSLLTLFAAFKGIGSKLSPFARRTTGLSKLSLEDLRANGLSILQSIFLTVIGFRAFSSFYGREDVVLGICVLSLSSFLDGLLFFVYNKEWVRFPSFQRPMRSRIWGIVKNAVVDALWSSLVALPVAFVMSCVVFFPFWGFWMHHFVANSLWRIQLGILKGYIVSDQVSVATGVSVSSLIPFMCQNEDKVLKMVAHQQILTIVKERPSERANLYSEGSGSDCKRLLDECIAEIEGFALGAMTDRAHQVSKAGQALKVYDLVFSQAPLVSCSAQILTCLVEMGYKEDSFGTTHNRKNVERTLYTLTALEIAVKEICQVLTVRSAMDPFKFPEAVDLLRVTRNCLYRVTGRYRDVIPECAFPPRYAQYLQLYCNMEA